MRLVLLVAVLPALAVGCHQDDSRSAAPATEPVQPADGSEPVRSDPAGTEPVRSEGPPALAEPPAEARSAGHREDVTLYSGFTPDPHMVEGMAGGTVNAQSLSQLCRGWITQAPSHLFVAETAFTNLRILVNGDSNDTTLVIRKPDGSYLCNDDAEGRNPIVASSFDPGTYEVWVGAYVQGANTPYVLGFTELGSVSTASLRGDAVDAGPSNFGNVSLAAGFIPDPHKVSGTSGGSVEATTLNPSCVGWISGTPDHLFVAQTAFTNLRILVHSDDDTTLVIKRPDGTYLCNDDAEGHDPIVAGAFPAGTYEIRVGLFDQGQNSEYTLGFTELQSVTALSLAP